MKRQWLGTPPKKCDVCKAPITSLFYDARTVTGQWACMCHQCQTTGPGINQLGLGRGQKYELDDTGAFVKTF